MTMTFKTMFALIIAVFVTGCSHKLSTSTDGNKKAEDTPTATVNADSLITRNNNIFAHELYSRISEKDKNLFYCPFSISAALAMTYAGARGETEAQMSRVLHFNTDQQQFHAGYKALLKHVNSLDKKDSVEMSPANALWVQKDYPFLSSYLDFVKKNYRAGLKNVDFRNDLNNSRLAINKWVDEETKGKIKDLLAEGSLTDLTRMVLVNAIYFKGAWEFPFKAEDTRKMNFMTSATGSVNADFMVMERKLAYAETEALQILELPYAGNRVSMLIFLPKQVDGIGSLEKGFSIDNYYAWTKALTKQYAKVFLPKFKMTAEFELSEALKKMGMTDAFSLSADFSGMTGNKDLMIDKIVHKAFIDVNEKGTEAAAATAVVIREKSMPAGQVVFKADHPFLFVLRDTETNGLLFIGKVALPGSGQED